MRIQRNDDMGPQGTSVLRVLIEDGDVLLSIDRTDHIAGQLATHTVEFCAPGRGGGRSPKTHAALTALAAAMQKDAEGTNSTAGDADVRNAIEVLTATERTAALAAENEALRIAMTNVLDMVARGRPDLETISVARRILATPASGAEVLRKRDARLLEHAVQFVLKSGCTDFVNLVRAGKFEMEKP